MTERELFIQAFQEPNGTARQALLDRACGADSTLRARVEGLLRKAEQAGSFLDRPAIAAADTFTPDPGAAPTATLSLGPTATAVGSRIGPYVLLHVIGEGGMGTVYLAEQTEPVKRRVALKLIKSGTDSKSVLARFEAERQALALMDHPNIAKVLDAGASRDGRPFFVMELVDGPPLTQYCDDRRLTVRDRLDLFVRVCQAVQHAHHKGVIHRDLKPSNILVAEVDGKPVPKVIDFGVAKATAERLTDKTLFTAVGTVVGTPEYMSPEQAEPGQMDIDTRSDVYSLGVVLYELMTGTTPLARERVRTVPLLEVLRLIREEDPPKPSTRLTIAEGLPNIAADRGLDSRQLTALLRGEPDWIVMRALEKDRNRRYETANSLALDIQRYLNDEAVLAGPPSAGYRLRKLARRNRRALVTAAVLVFAVVLVTGSLAWSARDRAARRARLDEEVTRSLSDSEKLFQRGKLPEALAEVKRTASLAESGEIDAGLHGRVQQWLTDLEMVARLQSVRLERDAIKDNDFDMAKSDPAYRAAFRDYGLDLDTLDPAAAAEQIRASAIRDDLIAALDDWAMANAEARLPGSERWQAIARLADPDPWRGRFRAAFEPLDRAALTRLARDPDALAQPPATALLLGVLLARANERSLAIEVLRQTQERFPGDFWANYHLAIELLAQKPPRASDAVGYLRTALAMRPESVGVHRSLGIALFRHSEMTAEAAARLKPDEVVADYAAHPTAFHRDRLAEAESCCRQAIRLNPTFAEAHNNLGMILYYRGRYPEAEAAHREAIRLKPDYAIAHDNLGLDLKEQNRYAEAIDSHREALRIQPKFAPAHNNLGIALKWQRKYVAAEKACRDALAINPDYASAHFNLGMILYSQLKYADAEASIRRAIELDATLRNIDGVAEVLASALFRQSKFEAAAGEYRRALRRNPKSVFVHFNLGRVLERLDKPVEAEAEYREAVRLAPDHADAHCNLGLVLQRQGKFPEALTELQRGHDLGSKRQGWNTTLSERWIRECQQQADLDKRLPAFLDGRERPAGAAESVELARLCRDPHGRTAASARFYAAAFATNPALAEELVHHHRYNAACAAVQAGTGQGTDATSLSNDERAKWRRQALDWLRADLAARAKLLQSEQAKDRAQTAAMLRHWPEDPDLKCLRDPIVQALLPAEEREGWAKLWVDLQAALTSTRP